MIFSIFILDINLDNFWTKLPDKIKIIINTNEIELLHA